MRIRGDDPCICEYLPNLMSAGSVYTSTTNYHLSFLDSCSLKKIGQNLTGLLHFISLSWSIRNDLDLNETRGVDKFVLVAASLPRCLDPSASFPQILSILDGSSSFFSLTSSCSGCNPSCHIFLSLPPRPSRRTWPFLPKRIVR